MEKTNQKPPTSKFQIGELYLFHPENKRCPPQTSLWGIYDKTENGVIHLELHSFDLKHFRSRFSLPKHYLFHRLATRSELRDFMYNLGYFDGKK
jgi:hypothetical protein